MTAILTEAVRQGHPAGALAANERLYKALGRPAGRRQARATSTSISSASQVAGLYVPSDKKLYVVSKAGGVGPLEKFTYSHEYTHALQDQNFDVSRVPARTLQDQSDRRSPGRRSSRATRRCDDPLGASRT